MKKHSRYRQVLWLFLLLATLSGCQPEKKSPETVTAPKTGNTMKAIMTRLHHYEHIPSASGIELVGQRVYVIGDDSPLLYVLDLASLEEVARIPLFETEDFADGRIPKSLKPDLECLTQLKTAGGNSLLALGSGSSPNRAQAYTIWLPEQELHAAQVQQHSLQELYRALQADTALLGGDALNLEAAATSDDKLLLLQRATKAGPNLILCFDKQAFATYLTHPRKQLPAYEAIPFQLPELTGLKSRFSGAVVYDKQLFFSASVENTSDALLDGEVLGSFIGCIDLSAIKPGTKALSAQTALVQNKQGKPFKGKIESLVILGSSRTQHLRALAITDNDQGQSELLELLLSPDSRLTD